MEFSGGSAELEGAKSGKKVGIKFKEEFGGGFNDFYLFLGRGGMREK